MTPSFPFSCPSFSGALLSLGGGGKEEEEEEVFIFACSKSLGMQRCCCRLCCPSIEAKLIIITVQLSVQSETELCEGLCVECVLVFFFLFCLEVVEGFVSSLLFLRPR